MIYKVKCPADILKNPCPGVFMTDVLPEVDLKCGISPFNTEVFDYVYDQNTCSHTWKVRYSWFCTDCGDEYPGCDSINLSCCFEDGCLVYTVVGYARATPTTVCTGSNLDYKVEYDFVDTCSKKQKCGFRFHGAAC